MLFIVTFAAFLIWAVVVIRKGRLPLHSLLDLYVCTLLVVDFGDVVCDYVFNFYDLPVRLLAHPAGDRYLGIVFSDGLIFPLVAIIYAYYAVRYRRWWLLSLACAVLMGLIEASYVKLGYMVYRFWRPWVTPLFALGASRLFAPFAGRFFSGSPPIAYWFRMVAFTYVFTEWPGALLSGVMHFYQWRPGLLANPNADDRISAMLLATAMGALAAVVAARVRPESRLPAFLGLGMLSATLSLWAYDLGWVKYQHWSRFWTVIRYVAPYFLVYWYDRWEAMRRSAARPVH